MEDHDHLMESVEADEEEEERSLRRAAMKRRVEKIIQLGKGLNAARIS